jgi:hypothetical protein
MAVELGICPARPPLPGNGVVRAEGPHPTGSQVAARAADCLAGMAVSIVNSHCGSEAYQGHTPALLRLRNLFLPRIFRPLTSDPLEMVRSTGFTLFSPLALDGIRTALRRS